MSDRLAQPLLNLSLMLIFKKFNNHIHNLLSSCLYCHQLNVQQRVLCQYCWHVISNYVGRNQWVIQGIQFHALIDWKAQKSDIVSALALNLKENKNHKQWKYLAWQLLKYNTQIQITANTVIVPSPAKKNNSDDHAFLLAQAICELTNLPMKNILERPNSKIAQKEKSKFDRQHTKLNNTENNSNFNDVIFIDDIVTTGSTAFAAYQALHNPQYYQVVSLIHRTI